MREQGHWESLAVSFNDQNGFKSLQQHVSTALKHSFLGAIRGEKVKKKKIIGNGKAGRAQCGGGKGRAKTL